MKFFPFGSEGHTMLLILWWINIDNAVCCLFQSANLFAYYSGIVCISWRSGRTIGSWTFIHFTVQGDTWLLTLWWIIIENCFCWPLHWACFLICLSGKLWLCWSCSEQLSSSIFLRSGYRGGTILWTSSSIALRNFFSVPLHLAWTLVYLSGKQWLW